MNTREVKFTVKVRNDSGFTTTLTVEPWGDQAPLEAGGVVNLACSGPEGGLVEVVVEPGAIVVFGWPGSLIEVV